MKAKTQEFNDEDVRNALWVKVEASSYRKVGAELKFTAAYLHDVMTYRRNVSEALGKKLGFDLVPPETRPNVWRRR